MREITIIGGGVAGMATALRLAEDGFNVTLIEQNTLGSGASGNNPGRMGLGFHYADPATAIAYLKASIRVQRAFPGYLIGSERPYSDPIRHGRYLFTKDSTVPIDKILATYEAIKNAYIELIAEDKRNKVFGKPSELFKELIPSEYTKNVNAEIVVGGVETAEHLFNWKLFLADIRLKIEGHPNITLYEHTKVVDISRNPPEKKRFTIICEKKEAGTLKKSKLETDFIINSTWQNIEALNDHVGVRYIPESRTNRLKVLLVVKLPESLKDSNSMFFCMGPHCMMSNLGDGSAMMTYANITNIDTYSGLKISKDAERFLSGHISESEYDEIAKAILEGVTKYIPAMKDAEVTDLRFGIVQTKGKLELSELQNPEHPFNARADHNIRSEQIGVMSNPSMKLFYFLDNAAILAELAKQHVNASDLIEKWHSEICKDVPSKTLQRMIKDRLDMYQSIDIKESDGPMIIKSILENLSAMKELKSNRFFSPDTEKSVQSTPPHSPPHKDCQP